MAKKKKKQKQNDLSIVYDVKEPFSWNRFWDEKVLANIKKGKQYLEQHGVLHYLLSPFQYRNRLIGKVIFITLAFVGGIIPRAQSLINEKKAQNAASELAMIQKKVFTSNNITIQALASSQTSHKHVLTFRITGDTKNLVPSTKEGYDVVLKPLRGVSHAERVKYSYTVVPIDVSTRILIVYVDNSEQNDTTGVFGLYVVVKDTPQMKNPIEVTLSYNQETNDLFKGDKINLTTLADKFGTNETSKYITTTKESLEKALNVYRINEERLKAGNIKVSPTYEQLRAFVDKNLYLKEVEDDSLTTVVKTKPDTTLPPVIRPKIILTVDGKEFSETDYQNADNKERNQELASKEMQTVMAQLADVVNKLNALNGYRYTKYKDLYAMSRILNKDFVPADLGEMKHVEVEK